MQKELPFFIEICFKYVFFEILECKHNTYGLGCIGLCGHCLNGDQCDHVNGSCPNGCDKGAYGDKCDKGLLYLNL